MGLVGVLKRVFVVRTGVVSILHMSYQFRKIKIKILTRLFAVGVGWLF